MAEFTREQLIAEAKRRGLAVSDSAPAPTAEQPARGVLGTIDDTVRAIATGMTAGFAPEIAAAGNALFGRGDYRTNLAEEEARTQQFREDMPLVAYPAEVLGGIATGGLGARAVASAPSLAARVGRSAALGAGYGGVAGAGYADPGLENRATGAAVGALTGATVGAAIPTIGAAFKPVIDATKNVIRAGIQSVRGMPAQIPDDELQRAATVIVQRLERDGLTPDQAMQRLQQLGPEGILADVGGESTRRLLRTISNLPGQTADMADEALTSRALTAGSRAREAVTQATGANRGFYQTLDELNEAARTASKPLYEQAYQSHPSLASDEITGVLSTPAGREALKKATQIMANQGLDIRTFGAAVDDAGNVTFREGIPLEVLDYVKQGFDDALDAYRDRVTGRLSLDNQGRSIDALRRRLISELDDLTGGDYAAARAAYAGPAAQRDALMRGRNIFNQDEEVTDRIVSRMSDDERAAFLEGATRAITDRINSVGDTGDIARRIFGNEKMRRAIRAAFPSDEAFDQFSARINQLGEEAKLRRAVTGNSTTAQQIADMQDANMGAGGLVLDAATGGQNLMQRGVNYLGSMVTPYSVESTRDAIGRLLLSGKPEDIARIARAAEEARRQQLARALTLSGASGRAALGAGAVTGGFAGSEP